MNKPASSSRLALERLFTRFGLGMRAKLIALFVVIKVVPLILLALLAWRQSWLLGEELKVQTRELTQKANAALSKTGDIAINDAKKALDERAREDIERTSTDTARRVADFLYARDDDIRVAANMPPDAAAYRHFISALKGKIVKQGEWELAPDGKSWQPAAAPVQNRAITSSIKENDVGFHYRAPEPFHYEDKPLYREITFVDLTGQERVKVTTSPQMDTKLKDVSQRKNTYARAETYFNELKKLKPGEVYVSDVIGPYVRSRVIGRYTPETAAKAGEAYNPEQSAYAGQENPLGKRFQGIVRWATPVVEKGRVTGYVTLALDHDHLMEFTAHLMPTDDRYTEIPDAYEGNYAFIWDHKGRSIVHPRHFSITGYDPETGDPEIPWLEDRIYNAWQKSGKNYAEFIPDEPTFVAQSIKKKPALELTRQGLVGLDCRYLNFAPQCTGWFDLTQEGGSGSFLILWSGLWKITTAASIPYYTGQYAASPRGFGFVTIGAGVDDFHRPATETKAVIDELIKASDAELTKTADDTVGSIARNLLATAASLSASTGVMVILVVLIAIWMASVFTRSITTMIAGISRFRSGERHFRFNAPIKDEMGALADSFDDMADSLVQSAQGALTITDLNHNIIYMNGEGLEKVGKTLPEILGKPYAENSIFPANTPYCPITSLLHHREPEVLHYRDGHYYRGTATYLTDKNGGSIGYVINTVDVTEMALQQQKTEEQRALLDTVFSASPDLIWYKDAEGRYLAVNPRFAALSGKAPEEIVGRTAQEIFPMHQAEDIAAEDQEVGDHKTPVYTEVLLSFADGHKETMDAVRTPIFSASGECVGILGVARDVSRRVTVEAELRMTQLELKKAVETANKASNSKSEFLARMSHEIRTPMNAIIGMTNITKRKLGESNKDNEEVLAHVRQIESSSMHLLGLLNDILDISKIEAGKVELAEDSFNLPRLADHVASIIRSRCTEKNIRFEVACEHIEHDTFVSDPLRLRQVLINLLGNAVKFTPEGGAVQFSITQMDRRNQNTLLRFSVRDSGIGIQQERIASLFEPFEQGGSHIAKQYGGTGLGLPISRSIVRLLGGDITVTSEEGSGSEFSFSLWLPEMEDKREEALVVGDTTMLRGKRVLLVDDVPINRTIVIELLDGTGVLIDEADDGQKAVDVFTASPEGYYDLILMDVQMPVLNGYQASSAIRALSRADAKAVPIIAMTANAFKEDVDKALAHGMNAHLAKPLEHEKLLELLARFSGKVSTE